MSSACLSNDPLIATWPNILACKTDHTNLRFVIVRGRFLIMRKFASWCSTGALGESAWGKHAILDMEWGMFRIWLGRQFSAKGGKLLTVPANHASHRRNLCGHVAAASQLSQKRSICLSCDHEAHADHNAACNIRRFGLVPLGLTDPHGPEAGTAVAARGALGRSQAAKRKCALDQPASSGCCKVERGLVDAPSFMAG